MNSAAAKRSRTGSALRVAYAWAELVFGWALTPALYSYRTMKSWRALQRSQRKRLVCEWSALVAFWCVILAIVQINGWWEWFIVMHLAPAWLAGSMQTVRKFTEHLGMFGDTIVSMTRTVVYPHQCNGRVFPNHARAVLDMLTNLSDPRVGPQWRAASAPISPIFQPQLSTPSISPRHPAESLDPRCSPRHRH
jgi:hypothetical protein